MEMYLDRQPATDNAIFGSLHIANGEWHTLENAHLSIPLGRYKVTLTVSGRARLGHLYTPSPEFLLPLLNAVPGRSAIRIHAANNSNELEGCIAVGRDRVRNTLSTSRAALQDVYTIIWLAAHRNEEVWITIRNASDNKEQLA